MLLGATAAQALLGATFRVTRIAASRALQPRPLRMATVHPSSVLRIEDDTERKAAIKEFVRELQKVAKVLGEA